MILLDATNEHNDKPTVKMIAYRFPQDAAMGADFKDRTAFGTSVEAIETATKLDFFPVFGAMFTNWEDKEAEVRMEHWELSD